MSNIIFGSEAINYMKEFLELKPLDREQKLHYEFFKRNSDIEPIYRDCGVFVPYYSLSKYIATFNWVLIKEVIIRLLRAYNYNVSLEFPGAVFHHQSNLLLQGSQYVYNEPYIVRECDENIDCLNGNDIKINNYENLLVSEIPDFLESIENWIDEQVEEAIRTINQEIECAIKNPNSDIYGKEYYGIHLQTRYRYSFRKIHNFSGKKSCEVLLGTYTGLPIETILEIRFLIPNKKDGEENNTDDRVEDFNTWMCEDIEK